MLAAGLWTVVLGYALLYAGTAYFIQGPNAPGLAQVFGISSLQTTAATTTAQPNSATSSTLT